MPKGRVYKATVRAVLLYGSKTWPLRIEDTNRLQVVDHRCLRLNARFGSHQRVSNEEIKEWVFGSDCQTGSFVQSLHLHILRWFGHVLRMPANGLPHRALFADVAWGNEIVHEGVGPCRSGSSLELGPSQFTESVV
ncbi:hypothetical protein PHET_11259 [Paragonimus heterotremus]|uniref:Uncharacterized protein n=1 Tax=Paragonimus heterotremus TaxID=100268 RepID=A0A8J4SNB0_9TREM|nr:hypothetical protein PHET_11259 [Paragonimus heterotremus]